MTKLCSLIPMLASTDLRRTIAFYERLGFKVTGLFGEPDPVWCCLERDGVEIMFNAPPAEEIRRDVSAKARDYQIFYFKVEDVTGLHVGWKGAGFAVFGLRVTVYGMKEFEIRDPEGYQLWFAQETDEPPTECPE